MRSPTTATAWASGRARSTVWTRAFSTIRSAAGRSAAAPTASDPPMAAPRSPAPTRRSFRMTAGEDRTPGSRFSPFLAAARGARADRSPVDLLVQPRSAALHRPLLVLGARGPRFSLRLLPGYGGTPVRLVPGPA